MRYLLRLFVREAWIGLYVLAGVVAALLATAVTILLWHLGLDYDWPGSYLTFASIAVVGIAGYEAVNLLGLFLQIRVCAAAWQMPTADLLLLLDHGLAREYPDWQRLTRSQVRAFAAVAFLRHLQSTHKD